MKAADLMRVVKRHILPHLPEFRVKRWSFLYATPVDMVWRAFHFQVSYTEQEAFTVWMFAQPLYVPADCPVTDIGESLGRSCYRRNRWWTIQLGDAQSEQQVMDEVLWLIQKVGLPFLGRLKTPADIIRWIQKKSDDPDAPYSQEILAYSYILEGDYRRARRMIDRLIPELQHEIDESSLTHRTLVQSIYEPTIERLTQIKDLLGQSPDLAVQRLYEWRHWSLKQLRLEEEIPPTSAQETVSDG